MGGHSLSVRDNNCWNTFKVYEKPDGGAAINVSFCMVGGHSLSLKYHSCWNALEVYEKPDGGAEKRFHVVWYVDIPFVVRYHTFCR